MSVFCICENNRDKVFIFFPLSDIPADSSELCFIPFCFFTKILILAWQRQSPLPLIMFIKSRLFRIVTRARTEIVHGTISVTT